MCIYIYDRGNNSSLTSLFEGLYTCIDDYLVDRLLLCLLRRENLPWLGFIALDAEKLILQSCFAL